jgi:mono/diheme cytochrome c family protein
MSRNPEGVVFYKIWNGRKDPDMPAFKSQMTKDEAWAVVAYAISLRP